MAKPRFPHIISYDIAEPKRLKRIHRFLKKVALPLQYSVFLIEADAKRIEQLMKQLALMIKAREDDIRIYPLPLQPDWCAVGKPLWDEGMLLTGLKLPSAMQLKAETFWDEHARSLTQVKS
ncbi:CRISPR-associated endonuclease Cas2 [uncultured Thiothrix sp.]|uniref:CRISPR-associated endonuclease Cas2 n=1 Tax=uncultured Thiothrix sp. TaxID=223185 RepID=UPI0026155B48|nr:CRISPR-associated endonuclease Cas2 [uncultured Thiothrix sp.]